MLQEKSRPEKCLHAYQSLHRSKMLRRNQTPPSVAHPGKLNRNGWRKTCKFLEECAPSINFNNNRSVSIALVPNVKNSSLFTDMKRFGVKRYHQLCKRKWPQTCVIKFERCCCSSRTKQTTYRSVIPCQWCTGISQLCLIFAAKSQQTSEKHFECYCSFKSNFIRSIAVW